MISYYDITDEQIIQSS